MSKVFTEKMLNTVRIRTFLMKEIIDVIGTNGKRFRNIQDFDKYMKVQCDLIKNPKTTSLYIFGSVLGYKKDELEIKIITSVCAMSQTYILQSFKSNASLIRFIKYSAVAMLRKSLKNSEYVTSLTPEFNHDLLRDSLSFGHEIYLKRQYDQVLVFDKDDYIKNVDKV